MLVISYLVFVRARFPFVICLCSQFIRNGQKHCSLFVTLEMHEWNAWPIELRSNKNLFTFDMEVMGSAFVLRHLGLCIFDLNWKLYAWAGAISIPNRTHSAYDMRREPHRVHLARVCSTRAVRSLCFVISLHKINISCLQIAAFIFHKKADLCSAQVWRISLNQLRCIQCCNQI